MQTMTSLATLTDSETGPSPVLTEPASEPADTETLQTLRRFHLAGPGPGGDKAWLDMDILPALLHPYRDPALVRTDYPVFVPPPQPPAPGEEDEQRRWTARGIADLMSEIGPGAGEARILHDNLLRLEGHVRRIMGRQSGPADARGIFRKAAQAMVEELGLKPPDGDALENGLKNLTEALPEGGRLVPLTPHAPLDLLGQVVRLHLRPAWSALRQRAGEVADATQALLKTDRLKRPGAAREKAVTEMVGEIGGRFFDPSALAGAVGATEGSEPLPAERRARLQKVLELLDGEALVGDERPITLIHDGSLAGRAKKHLKGWHVEQSEDPCASAALRFDEAASALAEVLRAERVGRLEHEGQYDPARHDPWLAQFDWRGFSREELHLIPPVVVLVSSDHVARRGMLSLSRLLLSGRPVQIIVVDQPAGNAGADDRSGARTGFRFELGYLGVSHREAWIQQTSVARPLHMVGGFERALAGTRTSLHVVATGFDPDGSEPRLGSWFYAGAALEARAHPCFHYDPEAGNSWARRLDFSENPYPQSDWPVYTLDAKKEDGGTETLSLPFTFADFTLLQASYAPHFRLVPDGIPESELATLEGYLPLSPQEAAQKVPYVWGVDGTGRLRRLAITRELALAARDRLGYWHTLQELAGVKSEYVEEAARRARDEVETAAREERETLQAGHDEELERVRRSAAEEVVNQLTAALLEVDVSGFAAPGFLEGLQGRSIDEVAAALLGLVRQEALDESTEPSDEERVEQAASELLEMIDPDRLEENSK
jgi:hypothetical protein